MDTPYIRDENRLQNYLVCTKLPEGKRLYPNLGQGDNADKLLAFARRRCGDCPEHIEAVDAESVGLEWHNAQGEKQPWGDQYRKGRFVILTNV